MKKQGFTLIELLAVIVILAVIAIITIPMITKVIDKAKVGSLEDSAYGLISSADLYYANNIGNQEDSYLFKFTKELSGETNEGEKLDYKGKIDGTGELLLDKEGMTSLCINQGKYYVLKNKNSSIITVDKGMCSYDATMDLYVGYATGTTANSYYTKEEIEELMDETNIFKKSHPIGSIYTTVSEDESTVEKMSAKYAGTTWEVYGQGRTLVGLDNTQTEFNEINKSGGSKEMQQHTHTFNASTSKATLTGEISMHGAASGGLFYVASGIISTTHVINNQYYSVSNLTSYTGAYSSGYMSIDASHMHTVSGTTSNTGTGNSGNLQPYIVVYMYKRIS